jgi:nickel transport protein
MKRAIIFPAAVLCGLILADIAQAHGVGYRHPGPKAVALEFYYSTGEAMAYQEAFVYSPGDPKAAFQTGRSDEHGRVAFVPDVSGDWRVVVRDMEGHMAEAVLYVGGTEVEADETTVSSAGPAPGGVELAFRAALGVSVLFNIAAFVRGSGKCI